jgi:hypothetical protein
MSVALLAVVALAAVAPGQWSGSTSSTSPKSHGSRARVTFEVLPGSGAIRPFVRVDLRGCRSTRTVHIRRSLGLVAAADGRFALRARFSPPGRAMKVRLRFAGRFVSETAARGTLRGRLRYAGGHVCRIPRLMWTTHPTDPSPGATDDQAELDDPDAVIDDDEPIEDGDYEEDDGPTDDDPADTGTDDSPDEP